MCTDHQAQSNEARRHADVRSERFREMADQLGEHGGRDFPEGRRSRPYRRLALLVLASFAVFATVVVLRVGIGATPYETTDSAGRAMGFNDPLNGEHYRIMAGNFRATALLDAGYLYEWILLAAHGLGAFFLLSDKVRPRFTRWFFALQVVVFPIGVPCLLFLPMFLLSPGPLDRESFVDIPFIIFIAQPVWIAASLIIVLTLRGPGLGLADAWKSLRETARAGRQKLAGVMLR